MCCAVVGQVGNVYVIGGENIIKCHRRTAKNLIGILCGKQYFLCFFVIGIIYAFYQI